MSDYGLTTKGYLTGIVLQMLENNVDFFLNSKRNPMTLWNKYTILTKPKDASVMRQV